jgi:hypothetical protein
VEQLESRVQPSFLTGGLDPGAEFADDLLDDRHHPDEHLAALASALVSPTSTNPVGLSSNPALDPGGPTSPATPDSSVQPSRTTAELAALTSAVRSLGAGAVADPGPGRPVPATATALPTPTLSRAPLLARPADLAVLPGRRTDPGGIHPDVVTWTTFQQDHYFAQWNAVASGHGSSDGSVFVGGFSSDLSHSFTAATVEKLTSAGTLDPSFGGGTGLVYLELSPPTFAQSNGSVTGLAVSADGSTVYLSANLAVSNNSSGFTGVVASLNAATGGLEASRYFAGLSQTPSDDTFNAVTTNGSGATEQVFVGGSVPSFVTGSVSYILLASFNNSLSASNYDVGVTYGSNNIALRSVTADPAGNLYFAGTVASATETSGLVAEVTSGALGIPWYFNVNNVNPGPFGAVNSVAWSGGFVYLTGTLNNSADAYPVHTDMILAKARDTDGSLTAPGAYGWVYFNGPDGMHRTGDLAGFALAVRNGEAFVTGIRNDTAGDPHGPPTPSPVGDPFVLHFNSTGDGILASEYGLGGSAYDLGLGLDFTGPTGSGVYVAGLATSSDFHSTDGTVPGGGSPTPYDGWVSSVVV